ANAVAAEAAGPETIAETVPDPGPEDHVGALQGPNFEKLRSLLAAPNRAEPGGNPPAQPSFAKLRSQLNRRGEEAALDGSSAKRRDRGPGSTRIGRLAAFFLSGSAAGSICVSLYGWSKALDAASLCLQA